MTGEFGLFDKRTNEVARVCFVKGNEHQATKAVVEDWLRSHERLGELLMHHDSVCLDVYGENVILPILLKAFGVVGLRALLDQGALKFRLQTHGIARLERGPDGKHLKGVHPLGSMKFDTPAHSDPQASVEMGFAWVGQNIEAKSKKKLQKELIRAYLPIPPEAAKHAVDFAHRGHELGRFKFAGLDPKVPFDSMTDEARKLLLELAEEMFDLETLSAHNLHVIDEQRISTILDASVDRVGEALRRDASIRRVFRIEEIPDLTSVFATNERALREVPSLRTRPAVVEFRKWLRTVSSDQFGPEPGQAYLATLDGKSRLFSSPTARRVKTLVVSGLSAAAGAAISGTPVGATLGALTGPVVDQVIDELDERVFQRMLKGWSPRSYFDEVVRKDLTADQ